MCNYNGRIVSRWEYIRLMGIEKQLQELSLPTGSVSGFDYSDWPIIVPTADKKDFDVVGMEWGFLPDSWYGKPIDTREKANRFRRGYYDAAGKFVPGITTLNATSEELLKTGKIYREAALHRRCLLVSPGFYEWRHIFPLGKKGQPLKTAVKYPYRIHLRDQPLFTMAAVYKPWTDKETGETVNTFAIVTTEANALMEQVHNSKKRMPTILPDKLATDWLTGNLTEAEIQEIARYQYPAEEMTAYTIAKDFREIAEPDAAFEYEGLPMLA